MMKNFLLINSGLPNNFWPETIEMANQLQNCLSTKTKSYEKFILEKKQSNKRQNFSHIKIFGSEVSVSIPKEKKNKLDYQHIQKRIFINFSSNIIK